MTFAINISLLRDRRQKSDIVILKKLPLVNSKCTNTSEDIDATTDVHYVHFCNG